MKRIDPALIMVMPVMYQAGRTAMAIADEFGVSADAVRYHLRKAGCVMPKRGRKKRITPDVAAAALKMHRGGICWKSVARLLGFNTQSLQVEAWKFRDLQINQEREGK